MLLMEVTTMTICVCVLGVIRNLLMRRWKWNECRCGTAKTRNAGCASMMTATSARVVVAGFVLAVAVAFAGWSFECVRLVFWSGTPSLEPRRWPVVLSVGMFGKTETRFCVLLARLCLDEEVGVEWN